MLTCFLGYRSEVISRRPGHHQSKDSILDLTTKRLLGAVRLPGPWGYRLYSGLQSERIEMGS